MATRTNPPAFRSAKNYERFKQELLAWKEITELSEYKRGIAVALSLPEDDETQIREKVFDQISIVSLKSYDGLDVLINFLDEYLAKDDLTNSLEKFEGFDDFRRSEGQSISEFVALFDTKYPRIEKKKMVLPLEILAFKLLTKANITPEEKLLVLTGMNYDNRETLYEEAKKSLKKFKGEGSVSSGSIKLEPAYFTSGEQSVLATGFRGRDRGFSYRRASGGTWSRQDYRSTKAARDMNSPRGSAQTDKGGFKKNVNPLGPDGNPKVCPSCGSYRHLLSACPDSWENVAKVNKVEHEHAVLFTGNSKEDVRRLCVDSRNCAILDSARSSTVCGDRWINSYIQSLDEGDKLQVNCIDGENIFKFGGGACLKSKGEYTLPAVIAGKKVTITTDVVDSDIPLLLSRTAMKMAAIKLDLENDTANIMGQEVALNLTSSGHYCIPIDKEEIPIDCVCTVNLAEQISAKYHTNCALVERSTKFGTNTPYRL